MTKWLCFLIYCGALIACNVVIWERQRSALPSPLVAAHDLPPNWLLQSGDVVPTFGDGRYVRQEIKKGHSVLAEDLTSSPETPAPSGGLLVMLPVRKDLVTSSSVNSGTTAQICNANNKVIEKANVRAVLCSSSTESCSVVLELTPADTAKVANATPGQSKVEPAGSKCE